MVLFFFVSTSGQKKYIRPVKQIPSVSLYNLNGDTINLLTLAKDKITFIDFWFVPCGPCFAEMNLLHKLYSKYKDNSKVCFVTVTYTDSAFVRPLIENRNTDSNQTYSYFKTLSRLDTFRLPVYFTKNAISKQTSFIKSKFDFAGKGEGLSKDKSQFPDQIFRFPAYPTILIFDKNGQLIYDKTGFSDNGEKQQYLTIQSIITKHM